ncbi:flagellar basal body rod protein FlgC [Kamptonema cortianum]|nr:flagellar basal body rod protein FlgC [Geitlerinema splendidum]MDK3158350.1 flagellar basal body rod protein FlgC [Kamptonema cortianum]
MSINSALRASSSGLHAERMRMDVISGNIANANSIRTPDQDAYRRKIVMLEATNEGVKVRQILPDQSPLREVSEPDNPFADTDGVVYYSNVNPIYEMVNLMTASRAYEANVAAFNSAKTMLRSALNIGRV